MSYYMQGPQSYPLMEKIFGNKIKELNFFDFAYFDFKGTKHLIARSGWSKQGGYEIYVENTSSGLELYDHIFEVGKEYNIKPGYPNLIERIESALLSCGNDFDNNDNPLECGFDKFVNLDTNVEFVGKDELIKIQSEGINKKLMGIKIDSKFINVSSSMNVYDLNNKIIGDLRSGIYSPHFKKVIGIVMVKKPFLNFSEVCKIEIEGESFNGSLCELPFL